MTNERMTLEEMEQKHPDESVTPTVRLVTLKTNIIPVNFRREWGTYCNGTYLL